MPTYSDGLPFAHGEHFKKWLAPFIGTTAWGLEVGSWEGRSALWLMENILTHPLSTLVCVDTWEGEAVQKAEKMDFALKERNFLANTSQYRAEYRLIVKKGDSAKILRTLPVERYSFAYIDGSHQAPDVLTDAVNAWALLKRDAVLIFDDYDWPSGLGEVHEPKPAIDAFISIFRERIEILDRGYQLALRKL